MSFINRLFNTYGKLMQLQYRLQIIRFLNLHEYQSKELMSKHGINIQRFIMADNKEHAEEIIRDFKVKEYVVKAQVLAGGRGKGIFDTGFKGGVHLTKDPHKVCELISNMIGNNIITKQTPKKGVKVNKVMIAEALNIINERYLAIVMDRESNGPVLIASCHGGMDIEEVSEKDPESIYKEYIDINTGLKIEQCQRIATKLKFIGQGITEASNQILRLYDLFIKIDASQIEINPFAETTCGKIVCFDAKINFDDNAAFRQKDIFAMEDTSESNSKEIEASLCNLSYIGLDGDIGCLVNGAGLAMATMDLISLHGGKPANFLDLGGATTESQVFSAFKILTSDEQVIKFVKCIFVNIFGGIVNCATIANGIVNSLKNIDIKIPIVVRLEDALNFLNVINGTALKVNTIAICTVKSGLKPEFNWYEGDRKISNSSSLVIKAKGNFRCVATFTLNDEKETVESILTITHVYEPKCRYVRQFILALLSGIQIGFLVAYSVFMHCCKSNFYKILMKMKRKTQTRSSEDLRAFYSNHYFKNTRKKFHFKRKGRKKKPANDSKYDIDKF